MAWRNVNETTQVYAMDEVVIFIAYNGSGLCVVAISRNLKLTTTPDRAITQSPCYVPLNLERWK